MATLPHSGGPAGGNALNLGVATLAAGAIGFLAFAMPNDIFTALVTRSGLPEILAAAQPPLGMKARGATIAAGAILTFIAVLILLRGLDRLSARPARAARPARPAAPEPDADAPRLRRADAHPDAPSRRPLLAGRDLGDFAEPDELDFPPDENFADLPTQPLPGFLTAEPPAAHEITEEPVAAEEAPAAEEEATAVDEEEPLILETPLEEKSMEELVAELPEAADVGDASITSLMQRLESGLVQREVVAEEPAEELAIDPEAEADFVAERPEPPHTPSWLAPQPEAVEAEAAADSAAPSDEEEIQERVSQPSEAEEESDNSITSLMRRLESGMAQSEIEAGEPAGQPGEEAAVPEAETAFVAEAPDAPAAPPEHVGEPVAPAVHAENKAVAPPLPPVDEFGELIWPAQRGGSAAPAPAPAAQPAAAPAPAPAPPAAADYPPPIAETQVGHRLRNALGEMQRLAASGG